MKRDLRVGRFASDDLSLMIFAQPRESPPKFLILRGLLERISEYFGLHVDLGLSMVGLAVFLDALSLIPSGFWSP